MSETLKQFSGQTEDELWAQVAADMNKNNEILQYSAHLQQPRSDIYFDIDIDLGGGFESGISFTNFLAPVQGNTTLRFHFHKEDWINEIGKVLGQEDVKLGYPELDDAFIIKTNQPDALKQLMANESFRAFLLRHQNCRLELKKDDDDPEAVLTFSVDQGITSVSELREIYHLIYEMIESLNSNFIQ